MPAGTWNLGRLRKQVNYVGLKDLGITLQDPTNTSELVFNIIDFPTVLTSGKNLFKIKASTDILVKNSKIHIEVLDSNGNPIYYEPINYLEADGTRVIAIYIYPDTPYGTATVYVAGRAKVTPAISGTGTGGQRLRFSQDVNDPDYQNFPNIIWSKTVTVAPERYNTSEIIFTKSPSMVVQEVVQPYLEITNLQNVATQSLSNNITYTIKPKLVSGTSVGVSTATVDQLVAVDAQASVQGMFSMNTPPMAAGQVYNLNPIAVAVSNGGSAGGGVQGAINAGTLLEDGALKGDNVISNASPQINYQVVQSVSIFETSQPFFTTDMNPGDILTIHQPLIDVPQYTIGNVGTPSLVIPAAQLSSPVNTVLEVNTNVPPDRNQDDSGMLSAGLHPLSGSYRLFITQILNDKKAEVAYLDGFRESAFSDGNTAGKFAVQVVKDVPEYLEDNGTLQSEAPIIDRVEATTNFTCSYTLPFVTTETPQSQSFAEVTLSDIEPATGDVYKVKTFYKAGGQFGEYIDAGETILEQVEILEDSGSQEANGFDGASYNRMGFFSSLGDYNTYFTSSGGQLLPNNLITPSFDIGSLMSGVTLTPASANSDSTVSYVRLRDEYKPQLTKNSEYLLSLNSYADLPPGTVNSQTNLPFQPILDIFVSGSQGTIVPDTDESFGGSRNSYIFAESGIVGNYDNTLPSHYQDNESFGVRVGTVVPNISGSVTPSLFRFKSTETQQVDFFLVPRQGLFTVSNISIKTFNETGFTPNFGKFATRMPSQFTKIPLSFKFQFFDQDGKKTEYEPVIYPIFFTGENTVVAEDDAVISGTVTIGQVQGQGMELAGVASAYLRTIGYEGFKSASRTDKPGGFLMYTGSVLPDTPDDYSGVGFEIVAHSESYLRFATDTVSEMSPGIDIRTSNFFFGDENTHISGSEGRIEISGSDLKLFADSFFLGSTQQFVSGGNGNIEISSSDFHLNQQGQVVMQGTITAEAGGTIGGWNIATNDLTSANNKVKLDANGPYYISSSDFQVDATGGITASAGNVGGWTIESDKLVDSENRIKLEPAGLYTISSSDFQVDSAGAVTASKGIIGGFVLGTNTLTATDFTIDPSGKSISLGSGTDIFVVDADVGLQLGHGTFASAPFSVTKAGVLKAESGTIGGWTLSSTTIVGANMTLNSNGTIESNNFASNTPGSGFRLTADQGGFLEVENARIRGTLSTAVFEKEAVNAVGGQLYIANSTAMTGSALAPLGVHSATQTTMSFENVSGFIAGEILSAKKVTDTGFATEYFKVESSSRFDPGSDNNFAGYLYVIRGYSGSAPAASGSLGDLASNAQTYSGSQVVVSTGRYISGTGNNTTGTGYVRINANPSDPYTPYIDIVERTGSAIYDVDLKVRLGDLSGLSQARLHGRAPASAGFGLYAQNVFLEGGIVANTGSIAGIEMESGKLFTGTGTHGNANTGFYIDSSSNFALGNKLTWDGSNLIVRGQIQLNDGSNVGNGMQWSGSWESGKYYHLNDGVEHSGSSYIAVGSGSHVASSTNEPPNAASWSLMAGTGSDGIIGGDGAAAKSLAINVNSNVYAFTNAADTSATPTAIEFVISAQNLASDVDTNSIVIKDKDGTTISNPSLSSSLSSGTGVVTGSISFASTLSGDKDKLPVTITVTEDGLSDVTTLHKVQGGTDGDDGSDAKSVSVQSSTLIFVKALDGTITPATASLTASLQNATADGAWGTNGTAGPPQNSSGSGNYVTTPPNIEVYRDSVVDGQRVTYTMATGDGSISDSLILKILDEGSGNIIITQTNPSHTFPASTDGTVSDMSAGANIISVFEGSKELSYFDGNLTGSSTTGGWYSSSIATTNITHNQISTSGNKHRYTGIQDNPGSKGRYAFSTEVFANGTSGYDLSPVIQADFSTATNLVVRFKDSDTIDMHAKWAAFTVGTKFIYWISSTRWYEFKVTGVNTSNPYLNKYNFGIEFLSENITGGEASIPLQTTSDQDVFFLLQPERLKLGTPSSMTETSGAIHINITGSTQNGTAFNQSVTQSFAKSLQGTIGGSGSAAKTVNINATTLIFTKAQDGTITPSSASFTASLSNPSDDGAWTTTAGTLTNKDNDFSGPPTCIVTKDNFIDGMSITYTMAAADNSFADTVTLKLLDVGAGNVQPVLGNSNHTFPAETDGTVTDFFGGGTSLRVFEGATLLKYTASFSNLDSGSFNLLTSSLGVSGGEITGDGTTAVNINTLTAMPGASGSRFITGVGYTQNGSALGFGVTQSFAKSLKGTTGDTGQAGADAKSIIVTPDAYFFVKAQDGTYTPASITISGSGQNLTQNGEWDTDLGTLTDSQTSTNNNSIKITSANFVDGMRVTFTTHGDDDSIVDAVTIKELSAGSGNVQTIISNTNHTFQADHTGSIANFDGDTTIHVFEGATKIPFTASLASSSLALSASIYTNITKPLNWISAPSGTMGGSSGTAYFDNMSLNGSGHENAIAMGEGPFGEQELLWECYPDQVSGPDGGWNSSTQAVDTGSAYMFVVYAKRHTHELSGSFYWGWRNRSVNNDIIDYALNTGTVHDGGNPYFMSGDKQPVLDRWYMHIGIVEPSASEGQTGGNHTLGGTYDLVTNTKISTANSYRFTSASNGISHRCYHYYNTVTGSDGVAGGGSGPPAPYSTLYQSMALPAVYKMDGTEPSIDMLLAGHRIDNDTEQGKRVDIRIHGLSPSASAQLEVKTTGSTLLGTAFDQQSNTLNYNKSLAGSEPITIVQTNESHTFVGNTAGVIQSHVGSGTTISVFEGATQLQGIDDSGTPTAGQFVVARSGDNITPGADSVNGLDIVIADHSGGNETSGSITYAINGKTVGGTNFSRTKKQNFTVASQGIQGVGGADGSDGSAGADARAVNLTMVSQSFSYNTDGGQPFPASSVVTATALNTTGTVKYQFFVDDVSDQALSTTSTYTYTPPVSASSMPQKIEVQITDAGDDSTIKARDQITTVGLQAASNAVTVNLSNEAHTLPVTAGGTVTYTNSGTDITVFLGTTQLDYGTGNNTFSVSVDSASNITAGNASTVSSNIRRFAVANNFNTSGTSATIVFIISVVDGSGITTSFEKHQTFAKSQQGADGSDGSDGSDGADGSDGSPGATGATGPNFDFLSGSLSEIDTTGGIASGLLMTSDIFGFHNGISGGATAAVTDFTSFLDSNGSFYLGGNASGISASGDFGYFAWNNDDRSLLISGSKVDIQVDKFYLGKTGQFISGSLGNIEISSSKFHLQADGDVITNDITASGILINGDSLITGAVTASGITIEGGSTFRGRVEVSNIEDFATSEDQLPLKFNGTWQTTPDGNVFGWNTLGAGAEGRTSGDHGKYISGSDILTRSGISLQPLSGSNGSSVLQLGDNSGNDEYWVYMNTAIPIDPSHEYRMTMRIKQLKGNVANNLYIGCACLDSNYNHITPPTTHTYGYQHTNYADATLSDGYAWNLYEANFTGTGGSHGQFATGTEYGRFMFIVSHQDQAATVQIDYIYLENLTTGESSHIDRKNDNGLIPVLNASVPDAIPGSNNGELVLHGNQLNLNSNTTTPSASIYYKGGVYQLPFKTNMMTGQDSAIVGSSGSFNPDFPADQGYIIFDTRGANEQYNQYGAREDAFGDGAHAGTDPDTSTIESHMSIGFRTYDGGASHPASRITSSVAFARALGGSSWYYDDNEGMSYFYPTINHCIIGTYESAGSNGGITNVQLFYSAVGIGRGNSGFFAPSGSITASLKQGTPAWVGPGGGMTSIDGNSITTGNIKSNNYSQTAGSKIDLYNGTITLGGSVNPNFSVDDAGLVTAANFREKLIGVDDNNSGSYLRLISGTGGTTNAHYNLVFDGSLGGQIASNMEISTTVGFIISDVELPITGSDKNLCDVFIATDGVRFDDGTVSTGYNLVQAQAQPAQQFAAKSGCFPIGTRILLSNGTWKVIQDIEIGDLVRTKEGTNVPVLDSFVWNVDNTIPMYTNGKFTVTDSHPLWVDGKWQTADKLGWDSKLMFVDNLYYLQTENDYIVEGIPATGVLAEDHKGTSIKLLKIRRNKNGRYQY
tara:strand:- start:6315 stop:18404 length:12090 start_codon:yes stop_codon:yes gene_type:complete